MTYITMNKHLFITLLLSLSTCSFADTAHNIPFGNVSIETTRTLLNLQHPPIVIDVRTPKEFSEGHIKGAKNIDIKADDFHAQITKLDKSKTYLIHCRSGVRSAKALHFFKKLGFTNLYHMHDGFLKWKSE